MPLLQTITPGEDSTTNGIIIEDTDELGQPQPAPDLTQYDVIEMDVRDSKKNLLAKYKTGTGSHEPYSRNNNLIDIVIDTNDGRTSTNKTNQVNFDIYGEDTVEAVPGEVYANVRLVKNGITNYPSTYDLKVPFLVFGKFTKAK